MAQPTTITPSNFMESAAPDRGTTLRYEPVGTRGKKITTGMMAVPPHQRCVGSAPSSPPDLWCLLMMLVMKIGTIQALGLPSPSEVSWACSRRPRVDRVSSLRCLRPKSERERERCNIKTWSEHPSSLYV